MTPLTPAIIARKAARPEPAWALRWFWRWVHFPYVSIAHLGDSRAYRISDRTCYQITLDDDIASRETRLGYALYSEALQVPSGGPR